MNYHSLLHRLEGSTYQEPLSQYPQLTSDQTKSSPPQAHQGIFKQIKDPQEHVKSPARTSIPSIHEYKRDMAQGTSAPSKIFDPDDLINCTYLTDPDDQVQCFCAKIVEKIIEHEKDLHDHPDNVRFLVRTEGDKVDEIIAYNEALAFVNEEISKSEDPDYVIWKFKDIIAHEGPLKPDDQSYKGSSYNVMVAWEDGSQTFEPLHMIAQDDPVTCARYAQRAGLLDQPGWKRFKRLVKSDKKMVIIINQAKLNSSRNSPI